METSIKIEIFKLVQRIIMVALTILLIYVMNAGLNKVLDRLDVLNTTVITMAKSTQNVAKEIDDLEKVISNNWMYKLFGGKK